MDLQEIFEHFRVPVIFFGGLVLFWGAIYFFWDGGGD